MVKSKANPKVSRWSLEKTLPWILIIAGTIALICSYIIMVEKLHILKNPEYVVSCDINPIISCGSVMRSDQAEAFGFPNPFLGLMGFPVLITIGVAMLAGARFKRWFWLAVQGGLLFALGFVHWLFYQAVYNIQALCPYCIVVWVMTIAAFWYVLLYNIRKKHVAISGVGARITQFIQRHHLDILIVWYLVIAGLILHHFWYYFGTLL